MIISEKDKELWAALDYLYDIRTTIDERIALVLSKTDEKLNPLENLPMHILTRWADHNYG